MNKSELKPGVSTRMTNSNRSWLATRFAKRRFRPLAAVAWALLLAQLCPALAAPNGNPGILPPQSQAYGFSYGEWAAQWWAWTLSFPLSADPANGSAPLDSNQSGNVWFLPGAHISSTGTVSVIVHQFTVPAGKALFFPVLTYWADDSNCPVFDTFTPEELLAFNSAAWEANVTLTACTIDDVPVQGLADPQHTAYRVQTPPFSYTLASYDNLLNNFFAAGLLSCNLDGVTVYPAEADGAFLMLAPLPVGQHTIRVQAVVGPLANPRSQKDITYQLTIVP